MKIHHKVAFPLAAAVFALLVFDTVVCLVTGHWTPVTDDQLGSALTRVAISVLVGATFGALLFVVFRERAAFAAGNRVVRLCRWPLLVGLGLRVFMFAVPPSVAAQIPEVVRSLIGSLTLLLTFVTAMVIGLATLRHNPLGLGARILVAVPIVFGLAVLLMAIDSPVGSPAPVTGLAALGISLLGASTRHPQGRRPVVAAAIS